MTTHLLSACAATALALAATLALMPRPVAMGPAERPTKGALAYHRPCGASASYGSTTTAVQVGAATTVLVRWSGMVAAR